MSYKFLEDISLADVAFEASGKTLEELFESAALATTNVMIKDLKTIKPKIKKKIKLHASTVENLLHDFLIPPCLHENFVEILTNILIFRYLP